MLERQSKDIGEFLDSVGDNLNTTQFFAKTKNLDVGVQSLLSDRFNEAAGVPTPEIPVIEKF